jgi:SAM-dependent MidA family methyltransferase
MQQFIYEFIKKNAPISFSQYIEITMYSKNIGYYMSKNPIGKNSDYITSPEITSLFGEIVAIWLVNKWQSLGKPSDIILVELGPGTGIMMLDILNTIKKFKEMYESLSVSMIEISPVLKNIQKNNLNPHINKISWSQDFSDIPNKKMLLVANEFFDALPVDQFIFLDGEWFENKITEDFKIQSFKTGFQPDDNITESFKSGDILERCFLGKKISDQIQKHIINYGGNALIIDYGYVRNRYISTIQAVKEHKYCNLFSHIGDADITHEVDFSYLFPKKSIITQCQFLLNHGIQERYKMLSKNLDSNKRNLLFNSIERLISQNYMGEMFKCVEI